MEIYNYAMTNLFPDSHFKHYKDRHHLLYVLLNKKLRKKKAAILAIGRYLLKEFEMIFEPE